MAGKSAVIVINSHVARGSVGGRASVFILQRMGFEVWWAPTVAFPWHAGHGRSTRMTPDSTKFLDFLDDLARAPWLGEVGGILTGYLGSAEQAAPVGALIDAVRAKNPDATYLCDPIVGDSYGLFQPEAVGITIRDHLLPRADIATPNRFELAWFAGKPLNDNGDLIRASRELGPAEMVVTSAFAGEGEIGNLLARPESAILFSHLKEESVPHGTGDALAALHLANRLKGRKPAVSLERAVAAVFGLIALGTGADGDEMPLIRGQALFETPPGEVASTVLDGRPE